MSPDLLLQACFEEALGHLPSAGERWDSLSQIRLLAAIEAEFQLQLQPADILQLDSPERVKALLKSLGIQLP